MGKMGEERLVKVYVLNEHGWYCGGGGDSIAFREVSKRHSISSDQPPSHPNYPFHVEHIPQDLNYWQDSGCLVVI